MLDTMQKLEGEARKGAKITFDDISEKATKESELGVTLRLDAPFVSSVINVGRNIRDPTSVITPDMLEAAKKDVLPLVTKADTSAMHPANFVGDYHAWRIESEFPIPGSMLADDFKRRFLPVYVDDLEKKVLDDRKKRETDIEVKLSVLDRYEERRPENEFEKLIGQLEKVADLKDEAAAANVTRSVRVVASGEDLEIFNLLEKRAVTELEEKFSRGEVSYNVVHPVTDATGLMRAVSLGLISIARLYLKGGADANYCTYRGLRPLHCAWDAWLRLPDTHPQKRMRLLMAKDVIVLLVEYGADTNVLSVGKVAPLHMASAFGHDDLVALLLRHGADPQMKDRWGRTAYDIAKQYNHRGCAVLLANWEKIKSAYRREEYRTEWEKVLVHNALEARNKLHHDSRNKLVAQPGLAGRSIVDNIFGKNEGISKAQERMFGRKVLPGTETTESAPVLTAKQLLASFERVDALRDRQRKLLIENAQGAVRDPNVSALLHITTAEYDMETDSLRQVDPVADMIAAGEPEEAEKLRKLLMRKDKSSQPWGQKLTKEAEDEMDERSRAIAEEDMMIEQAMREELEDEEKMVGNDLFLGAGVQMLEDNKDLPGDIESLLPARKSDIIKAKKKPINVVREDETAELSRKVLGKGGLGLAMLHVTTDDTIEEIERRRERERKQREKEQKEKEELRRAKEEESKKKLIIHSEYAKRILKRQQDLDRWKREQKEAQEARERETKEMAKTKKELRTTWEEETKSVRHKLMGTLRQRAAFQELKPKKPMSEEAATLASVGIDIHAYDHRKAEMMLYYLGHRKEPKSEGNTLQSRRLAAATMVQADTPSYLTSFTTTEKNAVQTRRPALHSTILRPSRFRTDTRKNVDASAVVREGKALEVVMGGGNPLAISLTPGAGAATGAVDDEGSDSGDSEVAVPSVRGALDSDSDLMGHAANAVEAEERRLVEHGKFLLAAAGQATDRQPGYGLLAANDAGVLPAHSAKRIAALASQLLPAGVSKREIARAAEGAFVLKEIAMDGESDLGKVKRIHTLLHRNKNLYKKDVEETYNAAEKFRNDVTRNLLEGLPADKEDPVILDIPGSMMNPDLRKKRQIEEDAKFEMELEGKPAARSSSSWRSVTHVTEQYDPKALIHNDIPAYGSSILSTWPLHRPGPLDTSGNNLPEATGRVGATPGDDPVNYAVKMDGQSGNSSIINPNAGTMVFRKYAVLDGVMTGQKMVSDAIQEEMVRALRKQRRDVTTHTSALKAMRESEEIAKRNKQKNDDIVGASMGVLMTRYGDTRSPSKPDSYLPALTPAARDTSDYLARIKNVRTFSKPPVEEDWRGQRDSKFSIFHGTEDPWKATASSFPSPAPPSRESKSS